MAELIELKNPLTLEERLQVTRLIGHDSFNASFKIKRYLDEGDIDSAMEYLYHIRHIESTIGILTQNDRILIHEIQETQRFDKERLETFSKNLEKISEGNLEYEIKIQEPFLFIKPIVHTVLSNLIKNSLSAQREQDKQEALLSIYPCNLFEVEFSEFRDNDNYGLMYFPKEAEKYEKFVAFSVSDKGPGFPEDFSYENNLENPPEKKRASGFGLYFSKLASKVLRAPLHIISKPGNTSVIFYNPFFPISNY
jgi:signal transduction histidine kinase